jgi:hypothetical protein
MDVCDVDGNKVGTVAHVYRYDLAVAGSVRADNPPSREEVIETRIGFLGFGLSSVDPDERRPGRHRGLCVPVEAE